MARRLTSIVLVWLGIGCSAQGSLQDPLPMLPSDAACPVTCGNVEVLGALVELAPASRSFSRFTRLTRTDDGWAVTWHDERELAAHVQHIDASGAPVGSAWRIRDAQGIAPVWDGSSFTLWAAIGNQGQFAVGNLQRLYFAQFDSGFNPIDSVSLLGPEAASAFVAYSQGGEQIFAYTAERMAIRVRQMRIAPGLALRENEHFLSRAEEGTLRSSLAWTGRELAATYFTAQGYRTTFLDANTLAETRTVDLGSASGEPPQDIQSVMGSTMLWIAAWEMASARVWLRAIDVASGAPASEPILLPWIGTLTALATAADAPMLISRPMKNQLGEPENDAILPIDTESKRVCQGTRFGLANIVDIEFHGSEGAALLDRFGQHLYFARLRCK